MKQLFFFAALLAQSFAWAGKLNYPTKIDIADYRGTTFLSLMQSEIKPALDEYAKRGFRVADGNTVVASLAKVEDKVSSRAVKAAGGEQKLRAIANKLSNSSEKITFYDLPEAIGQAGGGAGKYDLSTFLALVSGGGVAVEIDEQNIAYNVNYGSGEKESDERTGRSFGEAPNRLALDASDKHYLTILENYVRSSGDNVQYFYQSILEILLNNDTRNYGRINKAGQAVATDFIAVYIAEQDRHLMSNLRNHPWDEALLEVTLLSALHGGQRDVAVMYNGKLTEQTEKQKTGCDTASRSSKKASMIDYWQFSNSTDPKNCTRSGINITRKDFRKLGAEITAYQKAANPQLVARVQRHFKNSRSSDNVFAQLSEFLINARTPKKLDRETLELADDFTAFLMQVRKDADRSTTHIANKNRE